MHAIQLDDLVESASRSKTHQMTDTKPNVLSLFAGIGGLDLGLQRAGMSIIGQVEINRFCREVLARHWPEVPRHDDVRTCVNWWRGEPNRPAVDVVAGGFPCQPFSMAGNRSGTTDARWGWPWMHAVVRALRPGYVILENSTGILTDTRAFGTILSDLANLGFDAEWSVLSACALGAPHTRSRLFLLAYADRQHGIQRMGSREGRTLPPGRRGQSQTDERGNWALETSPSVRRVADGVPDRMDLHRVTALGNAVVPAVAEHVGLRMIDIMGR